MLTGLLPAKFIDLRLQRLDFALLDVRGSCAPRRRGNGAMNWPRDSAARGPSVDLVELLVQVPVEWVLASLLVVGWQVLAHYIAAL